MTGYWNAHSDRDWQDGDGEWHSDPDEPEEEYDESEDCGRWDNGRLDDQCSLAGTEWCDWQCPIGLPHPCINEGKPKRWNRESITDTRSH